MPSFVAILAPWRMGTNTQGAVEVTRLDVIRLQETVFLNDTLIDFYLRQGIHDGLCHTPCLCVFVCTLTNTTVKATPCKADNDTHCMQI